MFSRALATAVAILCAITSSMAAPEGTVSIKSFLHGRVESMKGRRIVVVYDFKSPLQLLDFGTANPFLVQADAQWRIDGEKLVGQGSGAYRWKPVLDPDVKVEFTVTPKEGRDAGIVLCEPAITAGCIVFSLADTFFSKKDRGARPLAHMINCCGVPEEGADRENVFRYVDRAWEPVLEPGKEVKANMAKRLARNRMTVGKTVLEGTDIGISLPKLQIGLYVLGASATWSEVRIEAVLDAAWLREHDIVFDPAEGSEDEDEAGAAAPEDAPPAVDSFERVKELLRTVGDLDAAVDEREKAANEVIARKRIADIPFVLMSGILYSADLTSRTLGAKILKEVAGKTLGYSPKMDAEKRKAQIRKWWAWVRQNRSKIDRDAEGGGR